VLGNYVNGVLVIGIYYLRYEKYISTTREQIGVPFVDPNLKLAVLGSLILDKYIDLGTP
jgi:hypothetical protein